ncbi:myosin E, putative [Plasmodium ovale]|uniref:Myosin E, putative n=1 Tax=Plasmodium ovale TaxID=36330 RepID=A0A1C3KUI0_PLAOA|nr:myosin E, putative [Plasmodium ovale]
MKNHAEDRNFKEGDLVWCQNTQSMPEQNKLEYSLCRVVEKKNDEQVILSKYNDYNGYIFVCDSRNIYNANNLFSTDQKDMMKLKHINEPSLLHHMYERFRNKKFYTKMGPLLIFINPKISMSISNDDTIEKYKFRDGIEDLNMNEYHVAHNALRNLLFLKRNQSIIITGESGSGKTEITNNIMKFLAYGSHVDTGKKGASAEDTHTNVQNGECETESDRGSVNMAEMLRHVNTVLEAFGSAVTMDNNNSSRFSKICTLHIDEEEHIKSFYIKKLLFDKERLINRKANENSFNIFYYIINGSSEKFKQRYFLKNVVEDYIILKNESGYEKPLDDSAKFMELLKSLNYIFDDKKEIDFIFSVLSALLLLGNVETVKALRKRFFFRPGFCGAGPNYEEMQLSIEREREMEVETGWGDGSGGGGSGGDGSGGNSSGGDGGDGDGGDGDSSGVDASMDENVRNFLIACKLLGIHAEVLIKYMTTKYVFNDIILMKVHNETKIQKKMENFVKTCYEELFNWVLHKINDKCTKIGDIGKNDNYINILDLAHFEKHHDNSLEALLLNTTNEAVLKMSIDFFYKKRVSLLKEEGIDSSCDVECIDNEKLYHTLVQRLEKEGEEESLFSYLENVSMKRIFDKSNLNTLIVHKFRGCEYIKKDEDKTLEGKKCFVITHSFGNVSYNTEHMIDKNIDILTNSFISMVKESDNIYMRQFCHGYKYDERGNIVEEKRRYSIQSAFKLFKREYDSKNQMAVTVLRSNLLELAKMQENTFCHFIMCMRCNENKKELYSFDTNVVLRQLRNFRIVHAQQLKSGYFPHAFRFYEFLDIFKEGKAAGSAGSAEASKAARDEADETSRGEVEDVGDVGDVADKADAPENIPPGDYETMDSLKERVEHLLMSRNVSPNEYLAGNGRIFLSENALRMLINLVFPKKRRVMKVNREDVLVCEEKSWESEANVALNLECVRLCETYSKENVHMGKKEEAGENEEESNNGGEKEMINEMSAEGELVGEMVQLAELGKVEELYNEEVDDEKGGNCSRDDTLIRSEEDMKGKDSKGEGDNQQVITSEGRSDNKDEDGEVDGEVDNQVDDVANQVNCVPSYFKRESVYNREMNFFCCKEPKKEFISGEEQENGEMEEGMNKENSLEEQENGEMEEGMSMENSLPEQENGEMEEGMSMENSLEEQENGEMEDGMSRMNSDQMQSNEEEVSEDPNSNAANSGEMKKKKRRKKKSTICTEMEALNRGEVAEADVVDVANAADMAEVANVANAADMGEVAYVAYVANVANVADVAEKNEAENETGEGVPEAEEVNVDTVEWEDTYTGVSGDNRDDTMEEGKGEINREEAKEEEVTQKEHDSNSTEEDKDTKNSSDDEHDGHDDDNYVGFNLNCFKAIVPEKLESVSDMLYNKDDNMTHVQNYFDCYNCNLDGNIENCSEDNEFFNKIMKDENIINMYNSEFKNNNKKILIVNYLHDKYILEPNKKQYILDPLKNIISNMEEIYKNKWNIIMCSCKYYFKTYTYNENKIILKKKNIINNNNIIYNEECNYDINKSEDLYKHKYNPIIEYITLPTNKNIHEICIANNCYNKYLNDKYNIICFQSRNITRLDFMNSKAFYTSINYSKVKTRNITHVHTDFSYMDDKMKSNFKQHVINEFINNPNISMDELGDSLLNVATYFYHEHVGTWCVFISKKKAFLGAVNIVRNRYLRMTAKNRNRKYNIVLFETPV